MGGEPGMGRVIGAAGDFYRLRVTRLDVSGEPDLEWRDDILYREPPATRLAEGESYVLEAISTEADETAFEIARYADSDQAHEAMTRVAEDLEELTKSRFEDRYLRT